ncbi:MAG: tripartite tricarboxylate transporter TctB family protein [Aurantimonas endophytica]|uniref:tripartite tricarboxylate transporter TctB family protein n=1 Tax=Aurantimonas endophytica TaxID=1522175 RepID=UPI003001316D
MTLHKSARDLLAGGIFVAFGLAFGYASYGYDLGTPLRMGPGFFPLALAGILILLGLLIALAGIRNTEDAPIGAFPVRGFVLIIAALMVFALTIKGLGLAPALFLTVLLAAFASRRTKPLAGLVMAVALPAFCIAVFIYALSVPVPLFGPWWPL